MPLSALVENWATNRIRKCFVVDEGSEADPADFDLTFVATLWSGKSQLAFRALCDVMDSVSRGLPRVLLLDYDNGVPRHLAESIPAMEIASGCVLKVNDDQVRYLGSGEELLNLSASLSDHYANDR